MRDPVEQFRDLIEPEPNSGCFLWTGALNHHGYGIFNLDGRTVRSHRLAYSIWKGPIPDGLCVDHICRVRSCCNPAHLRLATSRDNVLEPRSKSPALANSTKTHCVAGHRYDHANTYRDPNGWRQCRKCRVEAKARFKAADAGIAVPPPRGSAS